MEHWDVVRGRRMVRAFRDEPVLAEVVDRILDAGRRAPSAGSTHGTAFVVLAGALETSRYWDATLPAGAGRDGFRWQGLLRAPVLVLPCASAGAYVTRYAEPDKAATGLGSGTRAWPVPYWTVDTAFAAMRILDACVAEGLGACFFGLFEQEAAAREALGIPAEWQPIGTIALGRRDDASDAPGRSARRRRPALDEVVHRGGW